MTTVTYKIPNISCDHCVHTITMEVGDIPGVTSVEANAGTKLSKITFEPPATEDQIINLLSELNYPAEK